jgi:predicted nucleic acid-binding Zn ribbon protein
MIPMLKSHRMEPVAASIDRLTRELLRRLPANEAALNAWPLVCGSRVSEKAVAQTLQEGVLTIQVPSKEWSTELYGLRSTYLDRLNQLCTEKITEIKFVVRP